MLKNQNKLENHIASELNKNGRVLVTFKMAGTTSRADINDFLEVIIRDTWNETGASLESTPIIDGYLVYEQ